MYRTFGSGSDHKPYAFFMNQSKQYNKGCAVGLLRSAETRFASFFYAMHRALRVRKALEATIHSAAWTDMKKVKTFIVRAASDVDDKLFWNRIFVLLRALFPLLKLLRRADSNRPNMDKICYYLNETSLHLIKSKDDLMDENLFPTTFNIDSDTEADANYEEDDEYCSSEDGSVGQEDEQAEDYTLDEDEIDVYTESDEWGALVTDKTGVFSSL